jgi:hypothetical protein
MKIELRDPTKLTVLDGNRLIDQKQVERLKKAINKENLLHLRPIMILRDGTIVDGQHRAMAAIQLKLKTVPCILMEHAVPLEHIQTIQQNTKGWSLLNYAHSFAKQGKKDYQLFLDFVATTKIPSSVCITLLRGGRPISGGGHLENFRNGLYRVAEKNLKHTRTFSDVLDKISGEFQWCWQRSFLLAFYAAYMTPGFSVPHFMKQLESNRLHKRAVSEDYIKDIEDLYNRFVRKEDRLHFVLLSKKPRTEK